MDLPELPFDIEWRNIALVAVGIALVCFAFFTFTGNPINAYFKPTHVFEAGGEGTLFVEVKNVVGDDINSLQVTASAVNPNVVEISDYNQVEKYIGIDEIRKFEFPVEITEARQGTYSIEILANFGGQEFTQRVSLEVK